MAGALLALMGCSDGLRSTGTDIAESDLTADGGDAEAGGDAGARAAIPAFVLGDVGDVPRLRFAIDDGDVVAAIETSVPSSSSVERKLAMQGFSPVAGGKPAVYFEVGRAGDLTMAAGTYDCARNEALAMMVPVGDKQMTAVQGGPSRPCTIVIEDQKSDPVVTGPLGMRSVAQRLVGRFEAVVGARNDPASPTHVIRGAFATRHVAWQP